MPCFNEVTLIGHVTKDPELKLTQRGIAVAHFGVATKKKWKNDDGEEKERTDFHRITCWSKGAELVERVLRKGDLVFVKGEVQYDQYTDNAGNKIQTCTINSTKFMKLKEPARNTAAAAQPAPSKEEAQDMKGMYEDAVPLRGSDDDIPF